jgi:hypothetical protein
MAMISLAPYSTFKRPPPSKLRTWAAWQLEDITVRYFLARNISLVLCCRDCPRCTEWTPPQLLERFNDKLDIPLKALVGRVACAGEGGCGSRDIALLPHPHDENWTMPRTGDGEAPD